MIWWVFTPRTIVSTFLIVVKDVWGVEWTGTTCWWSTVDEQSRSRRCPLVNMFYQSFPPILRICVSGIPFDNFVSLSKLAPRVYSCHCKVILGVDRLDYTKGLISRLKSFQRLLIKYPRWKEKVMLLQVAVPSRHDQMLNSVYFCNLFVLRTDVKEYKELKEEIDKLVGCINGQFSTPAWSPIR